MTPEGHQVVLDLLNHPLPPELPGPPRPRTLATWTDGKHDNLAAAALDTLKWLDAIDPQTEDLLECKRYLLRRACEAIEDAQA